MPTIRLSQHHIEKIDAAATIDSVSVEPTETITVYLVKMPFNGHEKCLEGQEQIELRVLPDGTFEVWINPLSVKVRSWEGDHWRPISALAREVQP